MKAREVIAEAVCRHYWEVSLETISINPPQRADVDDAADEVLAALDAAGFVIVPKEPSEAMVERGEDAACSVHGCECHPENIYRAMISTPKGD